MREETIRVRVTTEQLALIDHEALLEGECRSELVRIALRDWVAARHAKRGHKALW